MKLTVCAVYDSAMAAYARPIFVPAAAVAVRSFSDEVNRAAADNQLNVHADDFVLHSLALFDEETGTFDQSGDIRRVLARGKDVKHSKE